DATRAQWQAVADEYVLDIKRMLMRGRMPLPELSVHTKYAFGEPVHIRTTSPFQGAWQPTLENIDPYQYDRRGLMFCLLDNKEYTSRLTVGPFGSGGMNLQLPGRLDAQDLDLSPGMHSVAYGWRHVDVVDPCQPDVSLHFDRLLTNTVEFEVVKALPEDYYRATFQPSWEEVLRHKITIAFTDDMPKYGVSGPLLALIIDRAPFDLAFDIFAQAEGSQEVLPAGSVAVVSGVRRLVPCDHHLESLNWETVGDKRWRLILKPSVHAAKARPPIREFYGREYVTDWATFDRSEQFERHYQTYLRRQGRETDRLGGTLKADRPVDLDRLNRRLRATGPVWPLPEGDELGWSTDNGGTIKIDPDSDVRMLWLSEANGNRIDPAQASVDRLSELAESPLKEIKPPKGERTLIAVRSSEGKVFWVTVRKVNETWADLSWWEHEQTNDGPADMPVAEGVSAEIKIARAALSVGDPVEIDVTLRNTSNEPVTLYCPVIYTARQLSVLKDGRTLAPEETGVMYDVPHPKANFHTLDVGQAHAVQLRGRVSIRTLPMRRGAARTQPTLTLDFGDTAFDLGKPGAFQIQLRLPIGQQETDTGTALGFANLVRGLVASNRIKLTVTQATAAQLRRAIDRLDRGTVQEKKDAMALLAANRDRQAVRAFVEILRAGPGPVFRDAINALVAIGDASVLPELTGMYLQMVDVGQAGGSDHVTSASLVLYLIERLQPPPEALKPFHQKVLLSQVSPWARAEAGVRLARLGDEQAVDALVALMHTGSPATQRLILRNMRWGGGGREMPASATEQLTAVAIALMRSTAPVAVRREAVKELAMALGDRSVPLLIDALKDKDLWVGLTAAIHLRGRGTSDAIAPLEEFLKRADTDHKRRVARETLDDIRQRSEATQ
ncbi:MAG: HEAT repeat domain-containing protein, partial [Phycisphaerae bacterium]|nr:HEAT repeat domain-containing protein [Phycisphaerae bacterium]